MPKPKPNGAAKRNRPTVEFLVFKGPLFVVVSLERKINEPRKRNERQRHCVNHDVNFFGMSNRVEHQKLNQVAAAATCCYLVEFLVFNSAFGRHRH